MQLQAIVDNIQGAIPDERWSTTDSDFEFEYAEGAEVDGAYPDAVTIKTDDGFKFYYTGGATSSLRSMVFDDDEKQAVNLAYAVNADFADGYEVTALSTNPNLKTSVESTPVNDDGLNEVRVLDLYPEESVV